MRFCFIIEEQYKVEPMPAVIADINDFPSFGHVPRAATLVSTYILHVARRAQLQRLGVVDILQPLDKQLRTPAQSIAGMYP